jgi:hypothetical protein
MNDLAGRLRNRVQLTSDGLNAVESAFGSGVDYAMLVKIYGETSEGQKRLKTGRVHRMQAPGRYWRPPTRITSAHRMWSVTISASL